LVVSVEDQGLHQIGPFGGQCESSVIAEFFDIFDGAPLHKLLVLLTNVLAMEIPSLIPQRFARAGQQFVDPVCVARTHTLLYTDTSCIGQSDMPARAVYTYAISLIYPSLDLLHTYTHALLLSLSLTHTHALSLSHTHTDIQTHRWKSKGVFWDFAGGFLDLTRDPQFALEYLLNRGEFLEFANKHDTLPRHAIPFGGAALCGIRCPLSVSYSASLQGATTEREHVEVRGVSKKLRDWRQPQV